MGEIFDIGDLVELQAYIRKPKLKGLILSRLDYDEKIGDIVYLIYCFSFDPPRFYKWPQSYMKKLD